jgi:hypothetical protein
VNLGALHLALVFGWLGVLGCEAILEFLPLWRRELRPATAAFHYYIDVVLELPLLVGIVATGFLLLRGRPLDMRLIAKLVASAIPVALNLACIGVVILRHRGSPEQLEARSRVVYGLIAVGTPVGAVALFLGLGYAGLLPP